MNRRLVESVAQTIAAMSEEERHFLATTLNQTESDSYNHELVGAEKSLRIAEIAQSIQAFEDKYNAQHAVQETQYQSQTKTEPLDEIQHTASGKKEDDRKQKSFADFFEAVQSLKIDDGPPDWSSNVNEHLNEDALSMHD